MSGRNFEQIKAPTINEVLFEELEAGDSIILETTSGSTYNFKISETEKGKLRTTINRDSDHQVHRGDGSTDVNNLEFNILGSCRGTIGAAHGEDLAPLNPTEGRFIVGEQAWLETEEGETMITSAVGSLQIIKAD